MRYLAFDVGCIECGESSRPIGLFAELEAAQQAANEAETAQKNDWHGQHYMTVYDLETLEDVSE